MKEFCIQAKRMGEEGKLTSGNKSDDEEDVSDRDIDDCATEDLTKRKNWSKERRKRKHDANNPNLKVKNEVDTKRRKTLPKYLNPDCREH